MTQHGMRPGAMCTAIRCPLPCKVARHARPLSSSSRFLTLAWSSCQNPGLELFLYPSWGPPHQLAHAARPLDHPFRLSGRFSDIFCIFAVCQKSSKKHILNFQVLGAIFNIFCIFPSVFSNFGNILGALGLHFSMFFEIPVLLSFLHHIFIKFRKLEKLKSAQNTAPVNGFKASPG